MAALQLPQALPPARAHENDKKAATFSPSMLELHLPGVGQSVECRAGAWPVTNFIYFLHFGQSNCLRHFHHATQRENVSPTRLSHTHTLSLSRPRTLHKFLPCTLGRLLSLLKINFLHHCLPSEVHWKISWSHQAAA